MKRRIALISILVVAIAAYMSGVVFASHIDYIANNAFHQSPDNDLPELWASSVWVLRAADTPVTWKADSRVRALVVNVLSTWTTTVPEFEWREVQPNRDANVVIYGADVCPNGPFVTGLFRVDPDLGWHANDLRGANYWQKATVCLASPGEQQVAPRYLENVLSHEIGHAYGLAEVYLDNPIPTTGSICNSAVSSIMDGETTEVVANRTRRVECDAVYGPTPRDVEKIRAFYSSGGPADWSVLSSYVLWRDTAYGESRHEIYYRYRLDLTLTTQREYRRDDWKSDIGSHKDLVYAPETAARLFYMKLDLSIHQQTAGRFATLPANTAYKACGVAYFEQYATYSTATCSDEIIVSNADHNTDATLLNRYDTNDNDAIDPDEVVVAVRDYFNDDLTADEVLTIVAVYFG